MSRKVIYPYLILDLYGLQFPVYHLQGYDGAVAIQETGLLGVPYPHGSIAVVDMTLEALVDFDDAAFPRLPLPQDELVSFKNLFPCEQPQVGDAEPKEEPASEQEGHPVIAIPV